MCSSGCVVAFCFLTKKEFGAIISSVFFLERTSPTELFTVFAVPFLKCLYTAILDVHACAIERDFLCLLCYSFFTINFDMTL